MVTAIKLDVKRGGKKVYALFDQCSICACPMVLRIIEKESLRLCYL